MEKPTLMRPRELLEINFVKPELWRMSGTTVYLPSPDKTMIWMRMDSGPPDCRLKYAMPQEYE